MTNTLSPEQRVRERTGKGQAMQSLKVEIHHILGMVAGAWVAAFVVLCLVAIYLIWKVTR